MRSVLFVVTLLGVASAVPSPRSDDVVHETRVSESLGPRLAAWTVAGCSDRFRFSLNKGWIYVNASTSKVENLLNTEYHLYTHPSGDTSHTGG